LKKALGKPVVAWFFLKSMVAFSKTEVLKKPQLIKSLKISLKRGFTVNILICDDQKKEAESFAALLSGVYGFDIKAKTFFCSLQALDYVLSGAPVDVCFLDIIMPRMDGIMLAEKLRSEGYSGEIIFLSNSNDFAHESYRVRAFGYMLKPLTSKSVFDILSALASTREKADREGITVKAQGAVKFILFRNISNIEVIKHNVYFRLIDGSEIKVYSSFHEIASICLKDRRFIQCHRSFLVNMKEIETVIGSEIIMRSAARIPISRGFSKVRDEIIKYMFVRDGR
jgi:DNA-binding LytR/AlgR family response regulator